MISWPLVEKSNIMLFFRKTTKQRLSRIFLIRYIILHHFRTKAGYYPSPLRFLQSKPEGIGRRGVCSGGVFAPQHADFLQHGAATQWRRRACRSCAAPPPSASAEFPLDTHGSLMGCMRNVWGGLFWRTQVLGRRPAAIRAYRYSVTTHQHYLALSHFGRRGRRARLSHSLSLCWWVEKTPTRKLLLSDGISFPEVHNEDGRLSAPSRSLHLWTRAGRPRWRPRGAAGGDLGEYYNAIAAALTQLQPQRCMSINS